MAARTISSFVVGEEVWLRADQGWRRGRVTKVARTRVTIRHPRNKAGDLKEKAYGLGDIVIKQMRRGDSWAIFYANGNVAIQDNAIPDMAITLT